MYENNRLPELAIENAKLVFRNFSGAEKEYNRAGDRNFSVVIEDVNQAVELYNQGWNVQVRGSNPEVKAALKAFRTFPEKVDYIMTNNLVEDSMFHLKVAVRYDKRKPLVELFTKARKKTLLDEDSIGQLDKAIILSADVTINPSRWQTSQGSGVKAYLSTARILIQEDPFAEKWAAFEDGEDEE